MGDEVLLEDLKPVDACAREGVELLRQAAGNRDGGYDGLHRLSFPARAAGS